MGWGGQSHAPAVCTPGKDPVPIVQEAGWAPGLVWTGGKSRPYRDSIPDRPVTIPTELPGLQCAFLNMSNHLYFLYFKNQLFALKYTLKHSLIKIN